MSTMQFLQRIGAINLPDDVLDAVGTPESPEPARSADLYESMRASVLHELRGQIVSAECESNDLRARLDDERVQSNPNAVDRIKYRIAKLALYKAELERTSSDENELKRRILVVQELRDRLFALARAHSTSARKDWRDEIIPRRFSIEEEKAPVPSGRHAELVSELAVVIDELVDDAVTRRLDEITDLMK